MKFEELKEGPTYFAKDVSISHHGGRILVEDSFSPELKNSARYHSYKVPVQKKDGILAATGKDVASSAVIPFEGYNIWGIDVHGPGSIEAFNASAIELHVDSVDDVYFIYKPRDLPKGVVRWSVPWAIKRTRDGLVMTKDSKLSRYGGTVELRVRGGDGVLQIERAEYQRFSDKYDYEKVVDSVPAIDATPVEVVDATFLEQ